MDSPGRGGGLALANKKEEMIPFIVITTLVQIVSENIERNRVFNQARAKANYLGKPLLNAGCGALGPVGSGFPRAILESDVNLDIEYQDVPRFVQGNIEMIPYPDKYFGAAFCGHVLEHIDNLDQGLRELYRVADYVYIIVPKPIWPSTWMHLEHKRVFLEDRVVTFPREKI